jgi:hypothetical protein
LRKGSNRFEPFTILPAPYNKFVPGHIAFNGDSGLYINDSRKIFYLDLKSGMVNTVETNSSLPDGINTEYKKIVFDNRNEPWVLCSGGWIAKIENGKLKPVLIATDEKGESIGYFNSIEADRNGNIWLSNAVTGWYSYNVLSGKINNWNENEGLLAQASQDIRADQFNRVWGISSNRLSVLLPDNRVNNYVIPVYENASSFTNAIEKLKNGNMLFAINDELIEFNAGRINSKPVKKYPVISAINIAGKYRMITGEKEIILKPDENVLRFRFGILIDKEIFPYEMEYMLEGAEKEWINARGKTEAAYHKLSPGTYTFRVKARGKNNNWESEEKQLRIIIKTPFYKTKWFLAALIVLIAGTLFFIYRYRLAQKETVLLLENKAQVLEKEKAMVMYESLKQHLNPHFLFNSLSSLSVLIETNQQLAGTFLKQMSKI